MRCKKHVNDPTSDEGVCASCLRERLFPILAVQLSQIQSQNQSQPSIPTVHKKEKPDNLSLLKSRLKHAVATSALSGLFSGKKTVSGGRRKVSGRGRGMSPARASDADVAGADVAGDDVAVAKGKGLAAADVAGFVFCLSPLVRARPKRGWDSKSLPLDVSVKPRLETASSFCKNRSRKVADFGRLQRRQ